MPRSPCLAFVVVVAAGCGSSGGRADGGVTGAGGRDGGRDSTFNPFDVGTTGGGGTGVIDAAPVDRGTPSPGALIYPGTDAFMLRFGPSCTAEEGATGDRWCAFVAASPTTVDAADLFVFNATKAAAGTAITCGAAAETNCLKLTADFAEDAFHGAFFQGDTLVYFDGTAMPFGWRPGMTAGRALVAADATTADVLGCVPAAKGTAIVCLKDLPAAMQTNANIIISDLILGTLDGAATPPLARVESVISWNAGDDVNDPLFAYQFLPGGQSLAWSTRTSPTGAEILKTQKVGDDASRAMIGSDIHEWSVSPDGTHWSWFSQYNVTTGAGTLQSAPFPGGVGPVANGIEHRAIRRPEPARRGVGVDGAGDVGAGRAAHGADRDHGRRHRRARVHRPRLQGRYRLRQDLQLGRGPHRPVRQALGLDGRRMYVDVHHERRVPGVPVHAGGRRSRVAARKRQHDFRVPVHPTVGLQHDDAHGAGRVLRRRVERPRGHLHGGPGGEPYGLAVDPAGDRRHRAGRGADVHLVAGRQLRVARRRARRARLLRQRRRRGRRHLRPLRSVSKRRPPAVVAAVLLAQAGCASTSYKPRADGRITMGMDWGRTLVKDGKDYPADANGLSQVVAGNPTAEEYARRHNRGLNLFLAEYLVGLGA